MTRLSLHHDDENPNLSIHLREGQYCTVGSSAAADYSFHSAGVEPVHCRIGCQASGGYIECFGVLDSISVNNVSKGRSRLCDGDTLRIGSVEWRVELPDQTKPSANFAIEFATEQTPTAKISEDVELEKEIKSFESPESASPESDTPEPRPSDSNPSATDPLVSLHSASESDSELATRLTPAPGLPAPVPSDPQGSDEKPDDDRIQPTKSKPGSPGDDSKPLFEFDSAEPGDLEITHAEFEEFSKPDPERIPMGAIDLESALVDTDQVEEIAQVPERLQKTEEAEPQESERIFKGGNFVGKYWRWNGQHAISALQQLMELPESIGVYRSNVNQLTVDSFEEISLDRLIQEQPAVFLISSLNFQDLQQLIRRKRWSDRIGHPQAVTMFLTFLPKRMLNEFFEAIDACVLIHENDVELLRIRRTYV